MEQKTRFFHLISIAFIVVIILILLRELDYISRHPVITYEFPGSNLLPDVFRFLLGLRFWGYEQGIGVIMVFIIPMLYGFAAAVEVKRKGYVIYYALLSGFCIVSFELFKWAVFINPLHPDLKSDNTITFYRIFCAYIGICLVGYIVGDFYRKISLRFLQGDTKKTD